MSPNQHAETFQGSSEILSATGDEEVIIKQTISSDFTSLNSISRFVVSVSVSFLLSSIAFDVP